MAVFETHKMKKSKSKIIIIGGGFAGVNIVRHLQKEHQNFDVTLIDKNNYNFFPPLLYQVATGFLDISSISYPFRKLFRDMRNFHFRTGELLEIRSEKNKIILSNGELHYDRLIIATGTVTNFFGMENIKENALPMKNIDDAIDLKNNILSRLEQATLTSDIEEKARLTTFVIAGGGPTGVEVAGMLAEINKNILSKDYPELDKITIFLVDGLSVLLAPMSSKSQTYTHKSLTSMGVTILLNNQVKDFIDDTVHFVDGTVIETKNLIWTAGVTAQEFVGIDKDCYGRGKRLIVNEFNLIQGFSNIYAVGDTCIQLSDPAFSGGHPQVAQVAIQQGKNLAVNLISIAKDQKMNPFIYNDKGSMAIIGRNKAVTDIPNPKMQLTGFLAWIMWLLVHLMSLVNFRNKLKTLYNWMAAYVSKDQPLRMVIKFKNK